ncbi:MAG TPA: hypothetical protein VLF94_02050 [Chlamydiales bacterium]|nr:hypothetical protein [Chlamydiales bacterium]
MPRPFIDWSQQYPAYVPSALLAIGPEQSEEEQRKRLQDSVQNVLINLRTIPTMGLMQKISDALETQAELRIQLFAIQMLFVKGSGKILSYHDTNRQIGSGRYRSHHPAKGECLANRSQFVAAHWATFPALKYKQGDQEFELAAGSRLKDLQNCTTLVPVNANGADSLVDGTMKSNGLRSNTIGILNRSAQNDEPRKLLLDFVEEFLKQITRAQETPVEQKKFTLDCYKKVATIYLEQLKNDAFVRKLFFHNTPEEQGKPIDATFFDTAHQEIHTALGKSPTGVPVQEVAIVSHTTATALGATAAKYAEHCRTVEKVMALARQCLTNPAQKQALQTAIKAAVKERYDKTPQKVPLIAEHLIKGAAG